MTRPHFAKAGSRCDSGFTLIEMLVALSLLALISSVLAASIGTARMALAFVERSAAVAPVQGTQAFFRSALAQARPIQRDGTSGSDLSFLGAPSAMTFNTSYSPRAQFEGLYRIEIGFEPSTDQRAGGELILTQTMVRPLAGEDQVPPPVARRRSRLLENVRSVEFNYFGALDDDGILRWRPTWVHLDKLPRLVAVDVQFGKTDTRRWQRLILPLFVSDASSVPCPPRRSC